MQVDTSSTEEPVIVMRRTFEAPRALVWAVFTDPKHVAHWYGGKNFQNPVCEMDVRPGGLWRHVMRTPDGTDFPLEFVFVEVRAPERLVWKSSDYETREGPPPACICAVTLKEDGNRTKWELVTRFRSLEMRDLAASKGYSNVVTQGSEKLAGILETLRRSS